MSNPPSPIQLMNNPNPRTPLTVAQRATAAGGPPPLGFNGTGIRINGIYTQVANPSGGCTRPFTGAATPASSSTYTINGVVVNTCATKKIKSSSGIR